MGRPLSPDVPPCADGLMKMIKEKSAKKRPEARLKMSDYRASQDELWKTARQAASPMDIGPHSTRLLRAWIAMGVGRMETEGRLSPENLAIAESNLKHFIQLMKTEAVFLGHTDQLDKDCFHAAHRTLEGHSRVSQFTLWPFWPNDFVMNN